MYITTQSAPAVGPEAFLDSLHSVTVKHYANTQAF